MHKTSQGTIQCSSFIDSIYIYSTFERNRNVFTEISGVVCRENITKPNVRHTRKMLRIIADHCELEIRIVNATSMCWGPNLILTDKYPDIFRERTFVNVDFLSEIISPSFRNASYWHSNDASCAINGRPKSNKYVMNETSKKRRHCNESQQCYVTNTPVWESATLAHTRVLSMAQCVVGQMDLFFGYIKKLMIIFRFMQKWGFFYVFIDLCVCLRLTSAVLQIAFSHLPFFFCLLLFLLEDLFYCSFECDKTETRERANYRRRKKNWRFFLSIFSLLCL